MPRLTLEFSDDVDRLLRDLARAENIDKYELIRRALALYQYLHKEVTDGGLPVAIETRIGLTLQALQRDLARLRPELVLLSR